MEHYRSVTGTFGGRQGRFKKRFCNEAESKEMSDDPVFAHGLLCEKGRLC